MIMNPHPPVISKSLSKAQYSRFPVKGVTIKTNNIFTYGTSSLNVNSSSKSIGSLDRTLVNKTKSPVSPLSLKKFDNRNNTTLIEGLEKQNSLPSKKKFFSNYPCLPSISTSRNLFSDISVEEMKRSSSQLSTSNLNHMSHLKNTDDVLTNTIKKMRLGSLSSLRSNNGIISNSPEAAEQYDINLIIRLPKGSRIHHCFKQHDTLESVVQFLSSYLMKQIDLKNYVLFVNQVPKREVNNENETLAELGIKDRTVLTLDKRDII